MEKGRLVGLNRWHKALRLVLVLTVKVETTKLRRTGDARRIPNNRKSED